MNKTYYLRAILTLVFAVAFILVFGSLRPKPISSLIKKEKFWADKVHTNKKYDLVFAGDSRVYRGIDPRSISEELNGIKALNFGFSSAGFNDQMCYEITARLDPKSEQKIIVLGITPYSLTPKAQDNSHFLQEKNRPLKEVFTRRFIAPALHFFDPVKPEELLKSDAESPGYYEEFKKDGWVASYKIPAKPEQALKSYVRNFKENRVSNAVVSALMEQVKNWRDKKYWVFALRMPSSLAMEQLEDSISGFDEEELKAAFRFHGGIWLDLEPRFEFESYDGSHLERESAKKLSAHIGRLIEDKIAVYQN